MLREKRILEGLTTVEFYYTKYYFKYKLFMFMSKEDLEDMKQDCVVEMILAVDLFDPTKGAKITTYLQKGVQGFIIDFLHKQRSIKELEKEWAFSYINEKVGNVFTLTKGQATDLLATLKLSEEDIAEFQLEVSADLTTEEIYRSLKRIPDIRTYIILSYYIMDKSISEINRELGYSEKSNWVYQLKREGIKQMKTHLSSGWY